MERLNNDELKSVLLSILSYFDSFCAGRGIQYSLAYGTLLGAVRHKGFIPWDDDIDVLMTREEFERLRACASEMDGRYRLVCVPDAEDYTLPLAKLTDCETVIVQPTRSDTMTLGVNIDLFVLDDLPDGRLRRALFFLRLYLLQKLWEYAEYAPRRKKGLKRLLALALRGKARRYALRLEKTAQKFSGRPVRDCGAVNFSVYKRSSGAFPKDRLRSYTTLSFEGREFSAFACWDEMLRRQYGDYMQLPPPEKRVAHHSFEPYWK